MKIQSSPTQSPVHPEPVSGTVLQCEDGNITIQTGNRQITGKLQGTANPGDSVLFLVHKTPDGPVIQIIPGRNKFILKIPDLQNNRQMNLKTIENILSSFGIEKSSVAETAKLLYSLRVGFVSDEIINILNAGNTPITEFPDAVSALIDTLQLTASPELAKKLQEIPKMLGIFFEQEIASDKISDALKTLKSFPADNIESTQQQFFDKISSMQLLSGNGIYLELPFENSSVQMKLSSNNENKLYTAALRLNMSQLGNLGINLCYTSGFADCSIYTETEKMKEYITSKKQYLSEALLSQGIQSVINVYAKIPELNFVFEISESRVDVTI